EKYLPLDVLAETQGVDPVKFSRGIGQERISVPGHDEDIVTMAAEAARPIIEYCGTEGIDTLMFATETGIDQSKAAGIYVHRLLDLPPRCRNVELKQACYSATAALQMACGHVARKPDRKVLILAADVSRYDLESAAEATQGAGAVAMLVSNNAKILEMDVASGCFTEDIMDFWRPNYSKTPFVDGKYSTLRYLNALTEAWQDYRDNGGREFNEFVQMCYHIPFSRMGEKAHKHLSNFTKSQMNAELCQPGMVYNRQVGNCYTASLYLSLISALENAPINLENKPIGLFSYGSGAVAEFFSGIVQPGFRDHLYTSRHRELLENRKALTYDEYINLWHAPDPHDGGEFVIEQAARGQYRLSRIHEHKRYYEVATS
ncbi:MAG: hydroxymethylglutaryl-CoA synthase, partial [Pseudomonadota bacterium]